VFESVRELLFNVVKHARVARATANLALTADDRIQVTIADEGIGFDPAAVFSRQPVGWGLFGIRERLSLLGGSLAIESAAGRGARFTLELPRADPTDSRPASKS
jgi:signal transduction histidine kinase